MASWLWSWAAWETRAPWLEDVEDAPLSELDVTGADAAVVEVVDVEVSTVVLVVVDGADVVEVVEGLVVVDVESEGRAPVAAAATPAKDSTAAAATPAALNEAILLGMGRRSSVVRQG